MPTEPEPSSLHVLERAARLSSSRLWQLQRRFFDSRGNRAWSEGTVPHYITSNAWIASAYARVVLGWLYDCAGTASRQPASFAPLDLRHPVHIVELGCGSGRFAYHFLRRLSDLLARSSLAHVPVRYVLTDFTASNLDFLRRHPALQAWIEEGLVDFALYDAGEEEQEIRLLGSGETLSPQTLRNPLVAVANYVFDGIPHDAFAVRGGCLQECLVTLTSPEGELDPEAPELLAQLQTSWQEEPAPAAPYGDPELDAVLAEYAAELPDTKVLFPCAAIRCARHLARLSDGRLLLLSGDKGFSREELLPGGGEPYLAVHGSFSIGVNYHALGRWFAHRGGEMLTTSHLHSSLTVVACLLGTPAGGLTETRLAFDQSMERMGPDDFFDVKKAVESLGEEQPLEQVLAWLRFSGWDASVLLGCYPALMKHISGTPEVLRHEVHRAIHEVWRAYFPLPEAQDLAFHLGVLLCELECHDEALGFFAESIASYGDNPATWFNQALCHFHLGRLEAAAELVDLSLAEAPDYGPAAELKRSIDQALAAKRPRKARRGRQEGTLR